jgi:hypothetical protein
MMVSDLCGAEAEALEEEVTSISGFDSGNARNGVRRVPRDLSRTIYEGVIVR